MKTKRRRTPSEELVKSKTELFKVRGLMYNYPLYGLVLLILISVAGAQHDLEITPPSTWFNVSGILPGESVSSDVVLSNTGNQDISEIMFYARFSNYCIPIESNNYCVSSPNLTDVLILDLIYGGVNITTDVCMQAGDGLCPLSISELAEGVVLDGIDARKSCNLDVTILFSPFAGNEYQSTSSTFNLSFIAESYATPRSLRHRRRYMTWDISDGYVNESVSIVLRDRSTDKRLDRVDVDIFFMDKKVKSMLTIDGLAWFIPLKPGVYVITAKKTRYRGLGTSIFVLDESSVVASTTTTSTTTTTEFIDIKCTPHYEKKCMGNFMWWFDSCGSYEEIAERCEFGCYKEFDFCRSYEEITTTTIQDVTTTTIDTNTSITLTTIDEDEPDKHDLSDFLGALAIFLGLMAGFVVVYLYIKRRNNSSEQ